MMRIGILGGAFDPVHNGHLLLARAAIQELKLDRLYFVPSFLSPSTSITAREKCVASPELRLEMLRAAISGIDRLYVSELEVQRKGISYTIDTVRAFRKEFPLPHELFFVAGADWAGSLRQWKDSDTLLSLCTFMVATRPGSGATGLPKSVRLLSFNALDISSSQIREMIRERKEVRALVPDKVLAIIQQHGLYQT